MQMEAYHYCDQVNEGFIQCVVFDGNTGRRGRQRGAPCCREGHDFLRGRTRFPPQPIPPRRTCAASPTPTVATRAITQTASTGRLPAGACFACPYIGTTILR